VYVELENLRKNDKQTECDCDLVPPSRTKECIIGISVQNVMGIENQHAEMV